MEVEHRAVGSVNARRLTAQRYLAVLSEGNSVNLLRMYDHPPS